MNEVKKAGRIVGYIIAIAIHIIIIYLLQRLPDWLPFLTDSYAAVMWLMIIGSIANIVANFLFIFYDAQRFKSLLQFLINIYSLIVLSTVYKVFPFDLSSYPSNWNQITRILIILAIVGTAIGTIVEFVHIFKPKKEKGDK